MCIILSMVENSGFSRNILKEKWRSTEVTVANLYTVVCRKRVEWVSCFRNLQTAGIPLVTPGLETELGVFSLTGYPRVESRSRVTLSCCWFFFLFPPLCCYCANSASSKRHLVKLEMFVIGGKRVPVICRNVYEDNLHGATTRGNVDACWDPIKIFARLGRRRNRKNRINESAVTFSHFEVGCTLAIAG